MWLWKEIHFTSVLDHPESNVGVLVFDPVSENNKVRNNGCQNLFPLSIQQILSTKASDVLLFIVIFCKFVLRPSASKLSHKNNCELGGMRTKVIVIFKIFLRNNVQGWRKLTLESEKEVVAK